jgi:CBS domain-containing protein
MPSVRDVLARKGPDVIAVSPTTSVLEAAHLMNARGVGSVLVLEGSTLQGIFTERDVLRRVVGERRDPATTLVQEVMTHAVVTCRVETTLAECVAVISGQRLRHLPVLGPEGLVGLISSGDVLAFQLSEQEATIQQLNSYVYDVR